MVQLAMPSRPYRNRSVCVFCGSSNGRLPAYREAAHALGRALASSGITAVYGGATVGLMGAMADAALASGGTVIGVIPDSLMDREIAHRGLTELHVVHTMHERKARMAEEAAAFLALPGGFGTLDEFCEILTWAQLGIHGKPCVLLNLAGYYDALLSFFDHAVQEGFLPDGHRTTVRVAASVPEAIALMEAAWSERRESPSGLPGADALR